MGLAVLPARLKDELKAVAEALVEGKNLTADPLTSSHALWAEDIRMRHTELTADNAEAILEQEVGVVFTKVLEDAGVFKRTAEGQEAFLRFVTAVNN